ncbi:AAA family ATPase [Crossiella sp. CA198]|uniref:AAA family ATPase n=1 Tax=Crossiella sp. CA198 TaxID=3455607 RepID=UPI003F8D2BAE
MLLHWADPLPPKPQRILVAGASGAGKTTMVRELARIFAVPAIELDALYHGPQWIPRPTFLAEVTEFANSEGWVCEWQYDSVRPLLAGRAQLLVWLDHPRHTVIRRVTWRTYQRRRRGELLWNGEQEPPLHAILTDPEHVIRWAWSTYPTVRARVLELLPTPLPVVRLCGQRQTDAWLRSIAG